MGLAADVVFLESKPPCGDARRVIQRLRQTRRLTVKLRVRTIADDEIGVILVDHYISVGMERREEGRHSIPRSGDLPAFLSFLLPLTGYTIPAAW